MARRTLVLATVMRMVTASSVSGKDRCLEALALISKSDARNFGNGYATRSETYEVPPGFWEGRLHYECLYYGTTPIAIVGYVSVSPSGKFILFDDGQAGTWVIGDNKGNRTVVGKGTRSFEFFEAVAWDEIDGEVSVSYHDGHPPDRFKLSRSLTQPVPPTRSKRRAADR